jgi:hypothetical protein
MFNRRSNQPIDLIGGVHTRTLPNRRVFFCPLPGASLRSCGSLDSRAGGPERIDIDQLLFRFAPNQFKKRGLEIFRSQELFVYLLIT